MNKAFTLIELLAVIVILSIIAVITTPIIIDVVASSKEKAFIATADSVSTSARNYQMNNNGQVVTFNFTNGVSSPVLKSKGDLPDYGSLTVDTKGKIAYALWSEDVKKCLVKTINDKTGKYSTTIKTKTDCTAASVSSAWKGVDYNPGDTSFW